MKNKKGIRMRKLHLANFIQKHTTIAVARALVVVVAAITTGAVAMAWGPDRPTFTGENPADYVTFNSITNNPQVGDERNFVRIRESGTSTYVDSMKLQPGKQYDVVNFYHNNAKTSLNASGAGIAKDVTLKASVPSVVKPGEQGKVSGTISSSNAKPTSVWDEAFVTSDTDIALRYVPDSAVVKSNGAVNGKILPSSLFTTGAPLGFDSLNGSLPGCVEYAGTVTYKLTAVAPNFKVTKQVSKKGANQWQDKIAAKPGEVVDFRVGYDNTGTTQQDNIVVKDALPVGMSYQGGSTILKTGKAPAGATQPDAVATNGLNIGSFAPNANAYVILSAKVDAPLPKCGPNDLVNYATVITPNGNKQATATVSVDAVCAANECKPGVPAGDARCATTPEALPTTGPVEVIAALIGLAAITIGTVYYIKSRRELRDVLYSAQSNPTHTTTVTHKGDITTDKPVAGAEKTDAKK